MPHVFLQSLDVISRHDAVHREGMPQIVHPVMLQTGRCQNVLEFLPDRRLGLVAAIRMIEHQAGEFTLIPQVAHLALLCILIRFVLLQHFHHEGAGAITRVLPFFRVPNT